MKKYFVFLDIDGTLWDNEGNKIKYVKSKDLNRDSVNAVNYLAEQLKLNGFNPEIVVISKQREHWFQCQQLLRWHGLNPNLPLIKLPIGKFTRGERISLLLHDVSKNKDIYREQRRFTIFDYLHTDFASKCDNYVVIDDDYEALKNIPLSNYIKTNIDNGRLTHTMVAEYLHRKQMAVHPPLSEQSQPKQK